MVKIEKIEGGYATIVREGKTNKVFANQLITPTEYTTLKVHGGRVMVSIYESELVWHESEPEQKEEVVVKPTESVIEAEVVKPAIVFPAKSAKSKK